MMAPRLIRSDCSRLGSARPNRDRLLAFSRRIWTRYIRPAKNATHVKTAPASKKIPCTVPQNAIVPPHSTQSDCRGENQPAMMTRPSTKGSTKHPGGDLFG